MLFRILFKFIILTGDWGLGIGDWGLGIGDWGLGIGPNPQSPIPNPQSPIPNPQSPIPNPQLYTYHKDLVFIKKFNKKMINSLIK